jgi:hypothetical protein
MILLGLGIALAVFAAGLRFYVTPMATNIPYDLEPSTTIAEARNGQYLRVSATGARTETGTLRSITDIVPQPVLTNELTGDLAGNAVVWHVYDQLVDPSSDSVVTASSSQIALDRKSGAYAEWDDAWVDAGSGEESVSLTGHAFKLPFFAEQKAYPYWDDTLGEAVDLEFVAVEDVSGLEAYKYEYSIPETELDYDADTVAALSAIVGRGTAGSVYYTSTRTIWVEPVTGQFLNQAVSTKLEFKAGSNSAIMVAGDFEYTDEQKADSLASISSNRDQIMLVSQTLPLAVGGGGLVLIVIGVVLLATGRKNDEAAAPTGA